MRATLSLAWIVATYRHGYDQRMQRLFKMVVVFFSIALPDSPGEVSTLKEERDAFMFGVVLGETPRAIRVARYAVPKTSWEAWWENAKTVVQGASSVAISSDHESLPARLRAIHTGHDGVRRRDIAQARRKNRDGHRGNFGLPL